jgi:signal transduction histidine kinase
MFFGGFSGGIAFHPRSVVDDLYIPPVVFTDFRLSGEAVQVQSGSPLNKSISYTPALRLAHDENIFSLEFAALSYFNPSTNRYRYKLEGLESRWHEVGSDQRLVSYTTLPPSTYTFRVQGATSRGKWSEPSLTLTIKVLAPWWNTWYARTLYAATILMLAWCGYHYRLRHITHQYNLRLEERIAERTRIAQELHDTLLQGILSASMQLHVATNNLPADSPMKLRFKRVLELIAQVIEEGRNAIRGLRLSQTPSLDLGEALAQIQREFSIEAGVHFNVVVTGDTMPLPAALRDEVYLIGREALINAFRHSRAQNIKVELDYDPRHFRLLVRDDGQGIHAQVLQAGLDGHWGLPGMRERAERLGGRLNVRSRAAAGTEIELSLPGHVAFRAHAQRPKWFRT